MSDVNQNKQDLLIKAIRNYDTKGVRSLLNDGVDINSIDNEEGVSPLVAAVETGLMETIELLLKLGADAEAVDSCGKSILYTWEETASSGEDKEWRYSEMLHLLLSHGAWVTQGDLEPDNSNTSILTSILKYGDEHSAELVVNLLKEKNISIPNILHHVAANESDGPGTLKFFLDCKQFDIHDTDRYGRTPLHIAANWDHPEQITMLLKHGADPNFKDRDASQSRVLSFMKCQCIIKQVALLESQNQQINPALHLQVQGSPRNRKYYCSCKKEIEVAQKSVIDGSITYYKIMTDQDSDSFANNKKVLSVLKSKAFVYRFNVYGQRICMHFMKVRPDQKNLFKPFQDKMLGIPFDEDIEPECITS
ncbi:hypothetical protein QAD02_023996 [Eretmocerus hayati]|uniref:Uncharacterized protein n=1 Tax=Eretmocerus hayati TaxID=131215 RepID=A0ACC2PZ35_9HYME|nr:hypothetical protein QAD02_023996 [Eretmocerus hayati]